MEPRMILLVEDEPGDEALTLRALEKNSIESKVVVVHDGAQALDFIFCSNEFVDRDPHDLPKLTLLDLRLPKLDGLEVLRRLRADERTRLLPVVILSSSNEEQDIIEAYKSGANSFVRKPVEFGQFSGCIQQLSSYWLQLNEPPTNTNLIANYSADSLV